MVMTAK